MATDDLKDLYQEIILDHGKRPRNLRVPDRYRVEADGNNPICGDRVHVYIDMDDRGTITDLAYDARGCAICLASASLMSEALPGLDRGGADRLIARFRDLVTGRPGVPGADDGAAGGPDSDDHAASLGALQALAGVRQYPMRVKCATLPWHAAQAALAGGGHVSSEDVD